MNKLLTVLGYRYRNQLGFSRLSDKNSSVRMHAIMTLGGYSIVFCLFAGYLVSLPFQLQYGNELEIFNPYICSLLFWGLGIWALLSGVESVIAGFDHEQLFVLPLNKWQARLANVLSQLLMQAVVCAAAIVISQIALFVTRPYPLGNSLMMLAMIVVLPLSATAVTMLVHLAVKALLHVMRVRIVFAEAVVTLVLFLSPLVASCLMQNSLDVKRGIAGASLIRSSFLGPVGIREWVHTGVLVAGSVALFTGLCCLLLKNYDRLVLLTGIKHFPSKTYRFAVASPLIALLKKEAKRYFSSFTYVVNTSLAPVLLFIVSAGLLVGMLPVAFAVEIPSTSFMISSRDTYFMVFMIGTCLTTTTSCSFSIEGRMIWISRHLPVSIKQLAWAKGLLNIGLFMPGLLLSAACLAAVFEYSGLELMLRTLLLTMNVLLLTVLGLAINLKFPSYDWVNEMVVVKQGASVLLTAVCSMAIISVQAAGIFFMGAAGVTVFVVMEATAIWLLMWRIGKVHYV